MRFGGFPHQVKRFRAKLPVIAALLVVISASANIGAFSSLDLISASAAPAAINWIRFATGADYARIPFYIEGKPMGTMLVARVNPASAIFRIYYQPGQRKTVRDWSVQWPSAILLVNASYFNGNGQPAGLVDIGDNILSAATGRPDSGMFQTKGDVPSIVPVDSAVSTQTPHPYTERVEGYPMLIQRGKLVTTSSLISTTDHARRTVIAQDRSGRMLFIVSTPYELTLPQMTTWLQTSNLGIVTALNFDGGASSQIHIASSTDPLEGYNDIVAVPVVLVAYLR